MINEKTATFENVTLTVRARKGADVWDEFTVKSKLPKEEREANPYLTDKFSQFVTTTVSVNGDLGFAWPSVGSSPEIMEAAYKGWCDMSPNLMVFWANLSWDANQPPLPEANTTPGNV